MSDQVQFDTPENVGIGYAPAGLGTRFIAWFIDQMIVFMALCVLFIVLVVAGVGGESVQMWLANGRGPRPEVFMFGLFILAAGLGSFFYFGLCELLFRGQTLGKRNQSLRVVKVNGFSLDAGSVLLRSIFRIVDHVPVLWVVPFLSARSQRLGDMVAGTLVVTDRPVELSGLREKLLSLAPSEAVFRFDSRHLQLLRPVDVEAIEKFMEREADVPPADAQEIRRRLAVALATRMNIDPPDAPSQALFLRDLLAAEYRRQTRHLG